ncbi:hypothetical protein [Streptosporangium vulgare]|uniref:Uncharacterized protein n=1 Tax=Streptosporangium vulgare TaxID=46190 RepID=A0ABV5TWB1_9ACTN
MPDTSDLPLPDPLPGDPVVTGLGVTLQEFVTIPASNATAPGPGSTAPVRSPTAPGGSTCPT